ncbi:iron-containing alcohol dehydrogenase [Desulfobaculum bizertense]|uniref:Alcohol dehydrogenase, class IV n=1 Tax=Desulfobaculum bizertense DSM 18034 TaxID=1121442 RepID=A0A1T4X2L1_9BACT|nr:iron-containing alcohol dehydrogenase [Desulfobaculum bizertense]UIJ37322.1 iron-containing alcohol dehydrogenase [Desulfobaculum bizertense]SKA83873.1 Alcohol dehydrogenase, class IV [Desulfobaculum bizertense DSM 18034]
MAQFTIPREVYFGQGTIDELKKLDGKKAVVVIGGGSIKENGGLEKILGNLKEAGLETVVFEGVESDPSIATVKKGVELFNEFQPDWIVGIGGGSPIDSAKAMWIFYEHPEFTFEEAFKPFNLPNLRKKAHFAAVTTTSGTGTEVTSFSVLTDEKTGIKYPIADFNITPDIAIVDTDLAQSMPAELVAHTGMDALAHSLEAYVSTVANELTDCLAMKATEMIQEHLLASYAGDTYARSKMHLAQCLAGMSFSNAILGLVHSMAHKTGKVFGIPHGCANAIYLPAVIRFNAEVAAEKYADAAKRLGLKGSSVAELVDSLVEFCESLNKNLQIPMTLKEFGVTEQDFLDNLDRISSEAVADPCTGTNPREITVDQMKDVFKTTYYGK